MTSIYRQLTIMGLLIAVPSVATAGLCRLGNNQGDCCCAESCPKKCVGECKSVKVTKHCWQTECEEVVIPPVRLPCCKCLFKGLCGKNKCGSCTGCSDDGCCSQGSCNQQACCRNSLLQRVFSKCASCRVRCVSTLKKHEYECEKNVIDWKVSCGGCCDTGCCDTGSLCQPDCCAPPGCN